MPNFHYRKIGSRPKKIKHISLKSLHKKAWDLQSEYIRRTERGFCYTCGVKDKWQNQQAGHYIHKNCLDFDSVNIHCQCPRCNCWLHGNLGVYGERLIAEYGEQTIAELRVRSEQVKKFTITELETLIAAYKQKLQSLQKEE